MNKSVLNNVAMGSAAMDSATTGNAATGNTVTGNAVTESGISCQPDHQISLQAISTAPSKTVARSKTARAQPQKTPAGSATKPLATKPCVSTVQKAIQPAEPGRNPPPNAAPMHVTGLNHFNITASPELIERVKQFYLDIVGLTLGPRAHLDHEGYWLYADYVPIVHLSMEENIPNFSAGLACHFNHISLNCVGLQGAIAKMIATQTPYRIIQLRDIHQTQVFLTDPAGIGVELTFFNESLSPAEQPPAGQPPSGRDPIATA